MKTLNTNTREKNIKILDQTYEYILNTTYYVQDNEYKQDEILNALKLSILTYKELTKTNIVP